MAVSAYDPSGRLKKHALLGTSLAADPTRTAQKEQFKTLHREAVGRAAEGRAGMLGTLGGRAQAYATPHLQRLQQIAEQRGVHERQLGEVRDPQAESTIARARDLYAPLARKYEGLEGAYVVGGDPLAAPTDPDSPQRPGAPPVHVGGNALQQLATHLDTVSRLRTVNLWDFMQANVPKEIRSEIKKAYWDLKPSERKKYGRESVFAREYVKGKAADIEAAQTDYQRRIDEEVESINRQYLQPLAEESAERQQRIADRIELYNMFLGA